jgi:hypothetical protein
MSWFSSRALRPGLGLAALAVAGCSDHSMPSEARPTLVPSRFIVGGGPPPPPPPSITSLSVNQTALTIDGPQATYTASLNNPQGFSFSSTSLVGFITQGSTRRSAGVQSVSCGFSLGILPQHSTCTNAFPIVVSNSTSGSGTLIPGPATFELQLQSAGVLFSTRTFPVTIVPITPTFTISGLSAMFLENTTNFTVSITNRRSSATGVAFAGSIIQGAAQRSILPCGINCTSVTGLVNPGTTTSSFGETVTNTYPGTGTLQPGPATFVFQMFENGVMVDSKTVGVTLVSSLSLNGLTPASTNLVIGGASTSYTATLQNTGPKYSDVVIQGWIDQGATRRAAGGFSIFCEGYPAGMIDTGTCPVGGSIVASNATAGTGTLVSGAATVELQVISRGTVLNTVFLPVTLFNP